MLHAVILAGGGGTRFWPQSRRDRPKQFLNIYGDSTLLQDTMSRVASWIPTDRIWVATQGQYRAETARELPALPANNVIVEPCARNTAPAIGLAALHVAARDADATMLIMPADHLVRPTSLFRSAVEQALQVIGNDPSSLVLFGVTPKYPATGFGYIERGAPIAGEVPHTWRVSAFHEKPNRAKADEFLAARRFYWNSGIFVWRASAILDALRRYEPQLGEALDRLAPLLGKADGEQAVGAEFASQPAISIDHAVLERSESLAMLEAPFEWDDVGNWQSLGGSFAADAAGNRARGSFVGVETAGSLIWTTPEHLVATIGLSDMIVVHTPDATLIARKDDDQSVRALVELLRERGYERYL